MNQSIQRSSFFLHLISIIGNDIFTIQPWVVRTMLDVLQEKEFDPKMMMTIVTVLKIMFSQKEFDEDVQKAFFTKICYKDEHTL